MEVIQFMPGNARKPALLGQLPAPKNLSDDSYDVTSDPWFRGRMEVAKPLPASKIKEPPPYGKRSAFQPKKLEDFGDGGAFPEIHYAQYPLNMGKDDKKQSSSVLAPACDAEGSVMFDAVVKQGENAKKIVYSQHRDLVPKLPNEISNSKPTEEEVKETTERTKLALERIVHDRLAAAQPNNVPKVSSGPQYIKYTPSQQNAAFNAGAKERTIKMVEMPVDPLEPPKHKYKRVPKASGSPPVPVMHSPPRPVSVKDQQDWKIPPCISNWKNAKGYTIPLDKRLAADGRNLQEVQINDNFAKLSEALYIAETKARESVETRTKIQKELALKDKEKKEQELRQLAQQARMERSGAGTATDRQPAKENPEEREERQKRDAIREDRRRERERERRLEARDAHAGKKSKITRDRDREITEKIALGLANVPQSGEVMYDQRLFDQEQGMASGFTADDAYNVYDKGLFSSHPSVGGLYKPRKDDGQDSDMYGGSGEAEESGDKLRTDRFRPDKAFAGATEKVAPRDKPVEFEQDQSDPFGLGQFLVNVKQSSKKAQEQQQGTMRASGGSATRESYEGGSSRSRVDFQRGR